MLDLVDAWGLGVYTKYYNIDLNDILRGGGRLRTKCLMNHKLNIIGCLMFCYCFDMGKGGGWRERGRGRGRGERGEWK